MTKKMSDPEIVFALYRPHPGKADELRKIVRDHVPALQRLELATPRAPIACAAQDGTIIEIFEWADGEAADRAHEHPEVAMIWEKIGAVADFSTLDDLPESKRPFSHFRPLA